MKRYVVYGPRISGWVACATWECDGQTAVRKLVTIGEYAACIWNMVYAGQGIRRT
jgi:hypothetical protein